jgi:uncharacterized membrane protein YvbJ
MSSQKTTSKISAEDIESRLRSLQGDVQDKVEDQKTNVLIASGVVALVLVIAFYFLGRRSGRRRSTLVEIKRV